MKQLLIWNGGSGKAKAADEIRGRLMAGNAIRCCELTRDLNLAELIQDSVVEGCEQVIAAGGDGTVNAIVNALMTVESASRPGLAIIPLGTANDFAGTLAIPDDLHAAVDIVSTKQRVAMDVIRISADRFERYFANVAAGGNSVRVSEQLTDEIKATWGAFCYVRGAIDVLADMLTYHVEIECDQEAFALDSWGVIIANGRTNAGRIPVAPQASPADGLLDVLIIRDGSVADMVDIVSTTMLTSFLDCEQVIFRQVKQVRLQSEPGMRFTLDGEVLDEEPIQFEVIPGAIDVNTGSDFAA